MPAGPMNFADTRERARRRLPPVLFDYIAGGSFGEETLARNYADFERVLLRQRVLEDVSSVSTATSLFGDDLAMPLALAPVGMAGMAARRGEVQAARAAQAGGIPFCLSTMGLCALEELAQHGVPPAWFQLYMVRDRGYMQALLERARAAGSHTLVFTVDLPVPGVRYRFTFGALNTLADRLRLVWQGARRPGWVHDVWLRGRPHVFGNIAAAVPDARGFNDFWTWMRANSDASVTWADIEWVRSHWPGPLVLKGILDPHDARKAREVGAEGIVVSNHGGRQLDGTCSTIAALPGIVEAVGGDLRILLDGGVRSGLDVLRALALGADGCLVGRAWAYALAAGGEAGVAAMIARFQLELRSAMALTGVRSLAEVGPDILLSR